MILAKYLGGFVMRGSGVRILFAAPIFQILCSANWRLLLGGTEFEPLTDNKAVRQLRQGEVDRPQGDPEGARRAAPSNPLCGTTPNGSIPASESVKLAPYGSAEIL
jgi:hypothetical protein